MKNSYANTFGDSEAMDYLRALNSRCKQDNTASNFHSKQNDNLPIQSNDANANPNNIPGGFKSNNIPQTTNDDANSIIVGNRNEMRDQPAVPNKPTIPLEVNIIQKNDEMKNQVNPPQFNNNFPFVRPNNMNQQEDEFDHNRNRLQSLEKEPNPLGDNIMKPPQIIVMDKANDHDDKNGDKPVESVPVGDPNQPDNYGKPKQSNLDAHKMNPNETDGNSVVGREDTIDKMHKNMRETDDNGEHV